MLVMRHRRWPSIVSSLPRRPNLKANYMNVTQNGHDYQKKSNSILIPVPVSLNSHSIPNPFILYLNSVTLFVGDHW